MMPDPPLRGRVVLVTRARSQAGELAAMLAARGASPLIAPAIRILPASSRALERAARQLIGGSFSWVVLTSRSGVESLFAHLGPGVGIPATVAAVGEGTAAALRQHGIEPDLVPSTFTTEALARAMPGGAGKVLLARADIASEEMEAALARKGWTPVRVDAYRTVPSRRLPAAASRALRGGGVDAETFTSASTVDGFVAMAGAVLAVAPRRAKVVCIGPVTAERAGQAGLGVDAVADPHTIEGLIVALERLFAPGRSTTRER
jgi:uroporphyrinogen-III synthase